MIKTLTQVLYRFRIRKILNFFYLKNKNPIKLIKKNLFDKTPAAYLIIIKRKRKFR